jgi:hypothetical protein
METANSRQGRYYDDKESTREWIIIRMYDLVGQTRNTHSIGDIKSQRKHYTTTTTTPTTPQHTNTTTTNYIPKPP